MVKLLIYSILSCCLALLAVTLACAQTVKEPVREQDMRGSFLFAEFYPASVLFKSGKTVQERMNYDVVKEEMVYLQDSSLQVLSITGIDTVYLAGIKMVPFNRTFCEVVSVPPGMLYIRHRYRKKNNENPSGYGGHTQTSNTASLRGTNMLGDFHVLDARAKYEVEASPLIWLRREGRFYNANNLRQLQKALPKDNDRLKQLVREQKTDFANPREVIELLELL